MLAPVPREVTPERLEEDCDRSLRPRGLHEYVGQPEVVANLRVFMKAARLRGEPLDHMLVSGPPGLGKTTLAHLVAAEMGVEVRSTSGPAILHGPHQDAQKSTNTGRSVFKIFSSNVVSFPTLITAISDTSLYFNPLPRGPIYIVKKTCVKVNLDYNRENISATTRRKD